MPTELNRGAFERLIAEDVEWLRRLAEGAGATHSLELDHINHILREAALVYYSFGTEIKILKLLASQPAVWFTVAQVAGMIRPMEPRDSIKHALEYLADSELILRANDGNDGMIYTSREEDAEAAPQDCNRGFEECGRFDNQQPYPDRETRRRDALMVPPPETLILFQGIRTRESGYILPDPPPDEFAAPPYLAEVLAGGAHVVSTPAGGQEEPQDAQPLPPALAPSCGAEYEHGAPIGDGLCVCIAAAGHAGKHECGCGNTFGEEDRTDRPQDAQPAEANRCLATSSRLMRGCGLPNEHAGRHQSEDGVYFD